MKVLIIIGVVLLILVSVWYAKKTGANSEFHSKNKILVVSDTIDNAVDFGYKMVWIAVKTNQKNRLAEIINLRNFKEANWESGIETAYDDGVYITPQIGEWTLIVGTGIPNKGDSQENILELANLVNTLSAEFGEAQFFGTHRVVEFHCWMKSKNGKMERIYSYVGESMESIKVFGDPTEAEDGLNLFNSLSKDAENEEYFEREDLTYADEILVMEIAEKWSVNPTKLSERTDIKSELGLAGK
ncbi:hypothetical protein [uncultured Maribacter sp.]|uniref:hypothetical protein n=1 Tax=uncultured Maribacter sp. TaxID=431308 RepID=UPI0026161B18|nr:hypothetical protein [uncultured Maribacter sp.]